MVIADQLRRSFCVIEVVSTYVLWATKNRRRVARHDGALLSVC